MFLLSPPYVPCLNWKQWRCWRLGWALVCTLQKPPFLPLLSKKLLTPHMSFHSLCLISNKEQEIFLNISWSHDICMSVPALSVSALPFEIQWDPLLDLLHFPVQFAVSSSQLSLTLCDNTVVGKLNEFTAEAFEQFSFPLCLLLLLKITWY